MVARNAFYDAGLLRSHKLPRPVIAIGNLTTGGTGKTPLVRWLAGELALRDLRPAVLMRGYRSASTAGGSDEQRMLVSQLGPRAAVIADPDRRAGAMAALLQLQQPDVFLLDDAFQHRRVARDFDLLLISATNPFGYGHVLPRGLLREPVRGLRRADAILVTRSNLVAPEALTAIDRRVQQMSANVPIFHADHVLAALRTADEQTFPLDELRARRFYLFSGIADPTSLRLQLDEAYHDSFTGARFFPDHHNFTDDDLHVLRRAAAKVNAHTLLTTEKDWVKIAPLAPARDGLPMLRLDLELRFRDDGDRKLLDLILARLKSTGSSPRAVPAAVAEARGT